VSGWDWPSLYVEGKMLRGIGTRASKSRLATWGVRAHVEQREFVRLEEKTAEKRWRERVSECVRESWQDGSEKRKEERSRPVIWDGMQGI